MARVGGPAVARPGRDAALHAAAPPAAGRRGRAAGHDQRQRVGRADRLPRRRRPGAPGRRSPTCFCSTTARSTPAPTTRWCARSGGSAAARADDAPLARLRAGQPRPARGGAGARAGLRRRAQEHVLRGEGGAGVGRATTSATWRTTRRCARSARAIAHFERLFAVEPRVVAHDLHPEYLSTKYALEREGVRLVGVQHHHAHLAACLAEHGETGPALGAIYDGTGYGTDGTVWGGELLVGDLAGFERAGLLCPGADARRRGGDPRAVADGVRLAARGDRRACRAARRAAGRGRARALGPGVRSSWRPASRRRSPRAWAGCSTRSPRSAACAPR